jgi:Ankyrin repeats (3 copies)
MSSGIRPHIVAPTFNINDVHTVDEKKSAMTRTSARRSARLAAAGTKTKRRTQTHARLALPSGLEQDVHVARASPRHGRSIISPKGLQKRAQMGSTSVYFPSNRMAGAGASASSSSSSPSDSAAATVAARSGPVSPRLRSPANSSTVTKYRLPQSPANKTTLYPRVSSYANLAPLSPRAQQHVDSRAPSTTASSATPPSPRMRPTQPKLLSPVRAPVSGTQAPISPRAARSNIVSVGSVPSHQGTRFFGGTATTATAAAAGTSSQSSPRHGQIHRSPNSNHYGATPSQRFFSSSQQPHAVTIASSQSKKSTARTMCSMPSSTKPALRFCSLDDFAPNKQRSKKPPPSQSTSSPRSKTFIPFQMTNFDRQRQAMAPLASKVSSTVENQLASPSGQLKPSGDTSYHGILKKSSQDHAASAYSSSESEEESDQDEAEDVVGVMHTIVDTTQMPRPTVLRRRSLSVDSGLPAMAKPSRRGVKFAEENNSVQVIEARSRKEPEKLLEDALNTFQSQDNSTTTTPAAMTHQQAHAVTSQIFAEFQRPKSSRQHLAYHEQVELLRRGQDTEQQSGVISARPMLTRSTSLHALRRSLSTSRLLNGTMATSSAMSGSRAVSGKSRGTGLSPSHNGTTVGIATKVVATPTRTIDANDKPLHLQINTAAKRGRIDDLNELIDSAADSPSYLADCVNWTDRNGSSALFHCGWSGRFDIAEVLLKNHANVNIRNVRGNTALHMAVEKSHVELVKFFLEHGADTVGINVREIRKRTKRKISKRIDKLIKQHPPLSDVQKATLTHFQSSGYADLTGVVRRGSKLYMLNQTSSRFLLGLQRNSTRSLRSTFSRQQSLRSRFSTLSRASRRSKAASTHPKNRDGHDHEDSSDDSDDEKEEQLQQERLREDLKRLTGIDNDWGPDHITAWLQNALEFDDTDDGNDDHAHDSAADDSLMDDSVTESSVTESSVTESSTSAECDTCAADGSAITGDDIADENVVDDDDDDDDSTATHHASSQEQKVSEICDRDDSATTPSTDELPDSPPGFAIVVNEPQAEPDSCTPNNKNSGNARKAKKKKYPSTKSHSRKKSDSTSSSDKTATGSLNMNAVAKMTGLSLMMVTEPDELDTVGIAKAQHSRILARVSELRNKCRCMIVFGCDVKVYHSVLTVSPAFCLFSTFFCFCFVATILLIPPPMCL